jgi:hypothetical protein
MTSNAVEGGSALGMAIDAKAHVDFNDWHYAIHRVDRAMTALTLDSGVDMRPMREADEVGQRVHPVPLDFERRLRVVSPGARDWLDSAAGNSVAVASHASRDRWNTRLRRPTRISMAVLTWDLVDPGVDSMTERDWLNDVCARRPRPLRERNHGASEDEQEQGKRKHYAIHAHDRRLKTTAAQSSSSNRAALGTDRRTTKYIRRNRASQKQKKSVFH